MDQMGERGASVDLYMVPFSCEPRTPREKLQTQMPTAIVQVTQLSKAGWIHTPDLEEPKIAISFLGGNYSTQLSVAEEK